MKPVKKLKIIVAMSGGVDSSVAAKILKDQGHEVIGIFLHFWQDSSALKTENKCCSTEALSDARAVAKKIGIPLYTFNFARIFKKQVVDNFLAEYKNGRTPNPCVRCNKLVKLGYLIKQAKKLGFDYVASGHYLINKNGRLYRAKDKFKDQSYFLYTLSQKEIKHLLFPLGNFTKKEVRALAKKFKLPVAEKGDSQEICFVPGKNHNEFLRRYLKLTPGPIKTLAGKIIGQHQGLPLYTLGQRRGIKLGGPGPFYAAKMDYKTNTLYVVNRHQEQFLFSREIFAKNVNWLTKPKVNCQAVIRYGQKAKPVMVKKITTKLYRIKFNQPVRAAAKGQSVVFYDQSRVLGGGIICQN
jgi:tRNA-uridine 2-sulfurtransferase